MWYDIVMKRLFLPLAVVWILFHLIVFLFVPKFIPYLGFFPYKEIAEGYHLPSFVTSLANFDGVHYIGIATRGYAQFEQAFFPLYPLLIYLTGFIFWKNYLLAGVLISSASFFTGLFFFKEYLKMILEHPSKKSILSSWRWAQLLLLAFPSSFFFTTVYTEGLFFLLAALSFYFLKKEKYVLAAFTIFFASLTKVVGVFLIIPVLVCFWKKTGKKALISTLNKNKTFLLPVLAPFIGLGSYCLYLWQTTGDPLFFVHAQAAFGANRATHFLPFPIAIYRYIRIFVTANHDFQYFIAVVEFCCFALFFTVLCYELWKIIKNRKNAAFSFYERLSLNIFSFMNLLLHSSTGTFSSMPRYVLMSLSFFVVLGEIKNRYVKLGLVIVFGVLHLLLFGFFMQGYFVG
jgi:Gpi18-like mannosyltransferase